MKDIYILFSNRSFVQKAEKIIAEDGYERVTVLFYNTTKELVDFAVYDLPAAAEVIITLPGPAILLEEILKDKIPIIPVEYNNIDIIFALRSALTLCPDSVALGHYKTINPRIEDISKMVEQPFRNFIFGSNDDNNINILKKLQEQKISAVVGGGYICNLAQKIGFTIFPFEINICTLRNKIKSACSIADTRKYMRHSQRHIDIILMHQAEAVIIVNSHNEITFINKSAEKIFGLNSKHVLGKKSSGILPNNSFETVLTQKKSVKNYIFSFHHIETLCDYNLVYDNDDIIGAIGTFNLTQEIHEKEKFARNYAFPNTDTRQYSFKDFQINNAKLQTLAEQAACYARSNETILITGESGTGKEVMANSIHKASKRNEKPFICVNCASIPPTLIDSELFGYVAGAFTGSRKNGAPGLFEAADGGTIFLDEISEMPFELQAKLLRVIQERKIRKIGATSELAVDVRIIAATNRNLEYEVAVKKFRMDLYYRLNILHIHMPSLREYTENIEELAKNMLLRLSPDSSRQNQKHLCSLIKTIKYYAWPGNLRELENIVRRYSVLTANLKRTIKLEEIFTPVEFQAHAQPVQAILNSNDQRMLETFNKLHGNRKLTAKELGISRSTLWRKLKKYNSIPN